MLVYTPGLVEGARIKDSVALSDSAHTLFMRSSVYVSVFVAILMHSLSGLE